MLGANVLVKMLLDLPADFDPEWKAQQLQGQMFFWAALDPAAAAQFADQQRSTNPELAAHGIVGNLAATDSTAAARWLEEHPDLRENSEVMSDYVAGLYMRDPAEARRYVSEHATEQTMAEGLQILAGRSFVDSADDPRIKQFILDLIKHDKSVGVTLFSSGHQQPPHRNRAHHPKAARYGERCAQEASPPTRNRRSDR